MRGFLSMMPLNNVCPENFSLEERFNKFLGQLEGAENIDTLFSEEKIQSGKRADFLLKNRQIILELKTLKTDPEEKVETLLELYRECPEFPIFYGELPLNRVLSCHPKGEEILHRIADALTRSVQGAMEKADDQIRATKDALNIEQACGIVAILNDNIDILSPKLLVRAVNKFLLKKKDNGFRYTNISCVWIASERHRLATSGTIQHLPLILLEAPAWGAYAEIESYLHDLQAAWACFNGALFSSLGPRENLNGLLFTKRK